LLLLLTTWRTQHPRRGHGVRAHLPPRAVCGRPPPMVRVRVRLREHARQLHQPWGRGWVSAACTCARPCVCMGESVGSDCVAARDSFASLEGVDEW